MWSLKGGRIPMSSISNYIEEISSFPDRNMALGLVEDEFLGYFAQNPCLSAYQLCSLHNSPQKLWISKRIHKKERRPMIYKNVHKRVKRLYELNLIEKEEKESERGAIYYRLSTGGIYYLIHNKSRDFIDLLKKVLQNHSDNIIFKRFLDPYVKRDTILQIESSSRKSQICSYLHDCCDETERAIESINRSSSRYIVEQVFLWQDVPGADEWRLKDFLKRKFDVDWLENAEIRKADENTIKISHGSKSISIKLNDKKDKAILTINRKNVYEFTFSRSLEVLYRGQSVKEFEVNSFPLSIKSLVSNLILTLALEGFAIESDMKALAQDKKFMRLLYDNKQKFDDSYQKLVDASL
jgi:hypothetical protein